MSHLRQTSCAGIKNYVVGAMDSQTADQLTLAGVPLFAMFAHAPDGSEISIGTLDLGWGSDRFHQMGRLKIQLLRAFLTFELDIMLCDSDTAWLQDPTSYLAQFPAADMLVSSDHLTPTIAPGDEGLEQPRAAHSAMNIGLMFVRATEGSKAFVHAWVDMLKSNSKVWDQNVFNDLVRQGFSPAVTHESNNRLFYGWNGRLVVGVLPVATFSSGHTFHVQHAHEVWTAPAASTLCTHVDLNAWPVLTDVWHWCAPVLTDVWHWCAPVSRCCGPARGRQANVPIAPAAMKHPSQ